VIKTENLTILFVDIAGFTATTSRQSRVQNARLLQTFGSTLLPLIKHYKGRLIKTIGDALLLTFRSPTDAMLCAMALQDAMHAHNLSASDDEKIHIRVAANLGEVRVTKKDIFGEPVNVASRIEGVAPADEIYLSEAVYMAMNKAEVPSAEVGFRELKGVSQAVRLYNIPRFSTPRLVAENASAEEKGSELLYPYGGMHYHARTGRVSEFFHLSDNKKLSRLLIPAAAVLVGIVAIVIGYNSTHKTTLSQPTAVQATQNVTTEGVNSNSNVQPPASTELPGINAGVDKTLTDKTDNASGKTNDGQARKNVPMESKPSVQTAGKTAPSAAETAVVSKKASESPQNNTQPKTVKEAVTPGNVPMKQSISEPTGASADESDEDVTDTGSTSAGKTADKAPAKKAGGWDVTSAKEAYRASKISKAEYSEIIYKLKADYKKKIVRLKEDYKAGKITRDEYEKQVRKAKQEYAGR
jgi:adenylate cyclase